MPKPRKPKKKAAAVDTRPVPEVQLRPHQLDALNEFNAGKRNQLHVWHRRGGKDWYELAVFRQEMERNPGTYWHMLPKNTQAKKAIWNGIDHVTGRKFLDLFFPGRTNTNAQELYFEWKGSSYQLFGSDNYDRAVGANPRGIVYSEWALCNPRARDYFRPIITANKGWEHYISTFRGRNHHWQMYNNLLNNPEWYVTLKTIDDTGLITEEDVQKDRDAGMSDRLIDQEYYCKPAPPTSLGPYARVFEELETLGSVRDLPVNGIQQVAVACADEYIAVLDCVIRGNVPYIYAGNVFRNVALQEALEERLTKIASGDAVLVVDPELTEDVRALRLPCKQPLPASQAESVMYLERAVISPTSVVAAAVTGSVNLWIDEEADPDLATDAVYAAMARLASLRLSALSWGRPIDYTLRDKAVICAKPNAGYRY